MGKSTIMFEWQEDQELPPLSTLPAQSETSNRGQKRQFLVVIGGAICLLAAALFGATWVERQGQAGLAEIQNELALAVDAEIWQGGDGQPQGVASTGTTTLLASTLHDFAGIEETHRADRHEKVISVEVQALQQDMAAVLVVTEPRPEDIHARDDPVRAYRQIRFYGRTEQGWQPIDSQPALWGQPQHLATAHFDFIYRSRDAHAAQAVAAEVDALYAQIRHNLGLPRTRDRKLVVEIVVNTVAGSRGRAWSEHVITVSSPLLLRAPVALADTAILRQAILLHLVDKGLEEAVSTHKIFPRWYPLLTAMRLWQTWDLGGPLSGAREPVLRWLYVDVPAMDNNSAPSLPAKYAELCALYRVWGIAPVHTGISLLCHKSDYTALYRAFSTGRHPSRFRDLIWMPNYQSHLTPSYSRFGEPYYGSPSSYAQDQFEPVTTAALLDYAAATFGHAQIGALWPILHEHENWDTLIPAVFGVQAAEFEAGWQQYMAEQYP